MDGIHARSVFPMQKRQFLRDQRQDGVHGEKGVFAHQQINGTLRGLNAQLIEVHGTEEAQSGGRCDALQRDGRASLSSPSG